MDRRFVSVRLQFLLALLIGLFLAGCVQNQVNVEKTELGKDDPCSQALSAKRYDGAVTACSKMIEAEKADYFNRRGLIYKDKNDYPKAFQDYAAAIELDPKDDSAYCNRAYVYSVQKDYDRALADYEKAIQIDPKDDEIFYLRGLMWKERKNLDLALADLNKSIELEWRSPLKFYQRALIWKEKNEIDRAISDFGRALEMAPDFSQARDGRDLLLKHKKIMGGAK